MNKISIIGAGNVGASTAKIIADWELCDKIVLVDVKENLAEGKAMDLVQSSIITGSGTDIIGTTGNYELTKDSDVIVITSGSPRRPGMTREELVSVNRKVVESVLEETSKYSDPIYIIVSNPMDTMTYFACNFFNHKKDSKIIGMGGILDSARFKYYIAQELKINPSKIDAYVLGGHGDTTMIPMVAQATCNGRPITTLLSEEQINNIVSKTMTGGAIMTDLLKTSAWQAPAAAIATLIQAIAFDTHEVFPCSVFRYEYNVCIGTRVSIGENGIEKYIADDKYINDIILKYHDSIDYVKDTNDRL